MVRDWILGDLSGVMVMSRLTSRGRCSAADVRWGSRTQAPAALRCSEGASHGSAGPPGAGKRLFKYVQLSYAARKEPRIHPFGHSYNHISLNIYSLVCF